MNMNFIGDGKPSGEKLLLLVAVAVSILTFVAYVGSFSGDFINYDDKAYLFENPVIKQIDLPSVISLFTSSHAGWWMPLTWLSFAVDYQIWGLSSFGFHLTNTLIHAANAALVVVIAGQLIRMNDDLNADHSNWLFFAASAGLLWSLHPLRVESVAWIAERKDVLNGFFVLLSVYFYLRVRGEGGKGKLFSILFFYLSLGAKSVSVVLPFMLLAIDYYPLQRLNLKSFWQSVLEKAPYLAGSVIVIVTTFVTAAKSNYLVNYEVFPFNQRLAVSGNAVIEYLRLFLLPESLSPLNVIPDPIPASYVIKAIAALIIALVVAFSRKAWLQSSLLCFLFPLIPVLAFFQNGDQAFADHFTYLPGVALSLVFAAVMQILARRCKRGGRTVIMLAIVVIVGLFTMLSIRMFSVWRSTESFWSRVIEIQPIAINYKERGRNYHLDGRYLEAVADFSTALERIPESLKPYSYNFFAFRAESLRCAGRYAEAVRDFDTAIALLPHPVYFHHRGLALKSMGRIAEAEKDFSIGGNVSTPIVWFDRDL